MKRRVSRLQINLTVVTVCICFFIWVIRGSYSHTKLQEKRLTSITSGEIKSALSSKRYNLVITAAFGMSILHMRSFIDSFHKNTDSTSRLLIIREPTALPEDAKLYLEQLERVDILEEQPPSGYSLHLGRYVLIQRHLTNSTDSTKDLVQYVALSDSRDVIFQSDPFIETAAILEGKEGVIFSLEGGYNSPKKISECPFNSGWIRRCFGEGVLDEISSEPVSCSGVTFGTLSGILSYVNTLVHISAVGGPSCSNDVGIDQGIHNYMAHYLGRHRNLLGIPFLIVANRDSPVATIGYTKSEDLEWDEGNKILRWREDKHVPSVVHQFDRHQQFSQHFFDTYN